MSLERLRQHRRQHPSVGSQPITLLLPFPAPPEPEHSLHLLSAVASINIVPTSPANNGVNSILSSNRPLPYPSMHLPPPPSSSTSSVFLMAASPRHAHLSLTATAASCAGHFPPVKHPPPCRLEYHPPSSFPSPLLPSISPHASPVSYSVQSRPHNTIVTDKSLLGQTLLLILAQSPPPPISLDFTVEQPFVAT